MTGTTPIDTIICGDCLEQMKKLPDRSIDAIVTDPPYELAFMGKKWDASGIAYNVDMWGECLRVLKPGGHLLAFGGARTYHRMACAIEDAGFEIRDSLHWVYGSGFPKSLDIGKAIDRSIFTTKTHNPDFQIVRAWVRGKVKAAGLTYKQIDTALGNANSHKASHYLDNSQPQLPTPEDWEIIKQLLKLDESIDIDRPPKLLVETFEREIIGYRKCHAGLAFTSEGPTELPITKPLSKEAEQWAGWGSALKPAHEPVVLARKPLDGCTIAENVLRWGCGGLNVDGCRIEVSDRKQYEFNHAGRSRGDTSRTKNLYSGFNYEKENPSLIGRFPANLIWSHSPLCKRIGTKKVKGGNDPRRKDGSKSGHNFHGFQDKNAHDHRPCTHSGYADENGMEEVESWDCDPSCPSWQFAKAGESKSQRSMRGLAGRHDPGQGPEHNRIKPYSNSVRGHDDEGSPARFFQACPFTEEDIPAFTYHAKASRAERERGLDGMPTVPAKNHTTGNNGEGDHRTIGRATTLEKHPLAMAHNNHPTVKPLSLMRYLCKLITPPGGLILDPFGGSGTTGIAAIKEGFHYILIEQQEEYCEIARKRVAAVPTRLDRWAEAEG